MAPRMAAHPNAPMHGEPESTAHWFQTTPTHRYEITIGASGLRVFAFTLAGESVPLSGFSGVAVVDTENGRRTYRLHQAEGHLESDRDSRLSGVARVILHLDFHSGTETVVFEPPAS